MHKIEPTMDKTSNNGLHRRRDVLRFKKMRCRHFSRLDATLIVLPVQATLKPRGGGPAPRGVGVIPPLGEGGWGGGIPGTPGQSFFFFSRGNLCAFEIRLEGHLGLGEGFIDGAAGRGGRDDMRAGKWGL